jgi:phage N-6-adenine-methyltransferase
MTKTDVHFSSDSDEWETPQWLYNELDAEFGFYFDAAAQTNNAKRLEFSSDSLGMDWSTLSPVWCNPPYSRGKQKYFLAKAVEEQKKGTTSVFLIPARTDTKAWHEYIWDTRLQRPKEGIEVRFLKGRLKFERGGKPILDKNGRPQSAPFPSVVVVFHGKS